MVSANKPLLPARAAAVVRAANLARASIAMSRTAARKSSSQGAGTPPSASTTAVANEVQNHSGRWTTWSLAALLAVLTAVVVYLCMCVRYYYRTVPCSDVSIVQCTAATFDPAMLSDRQPIVCRDVAIDSLLAANNDAEAYATLAIHGLFYRPQPLLHRHSTGETAEPTTALDDVTFIVCTSRDQPLQVRLFHPEHPCTAPEDEDEDKDVSNNSNHRAGTVVDIILHRADGLFVPFKWRYDLLSGDDAAAKSPSNKDPSSHARRVFRWRNCVMHPVNQLILS